MIGGPSEQNIKTVVDKLPWRWEKIVGWAVSHFIKNQKPERTEFERVKNGYVIKVKTDSENAKDAQEFWREHVMPELEGEK